MCFLCGVHAQPLTGISTIQAAGSEFRFPAASASRDGASASTARVSASTMGDTLDRSFTEEAAATVARSQAPAQKPAKKKNKKKGKGKGK